MSQNKVPPTFGPSSGPLVPAGRLTPLDRISFTDFLDLSQIDALVGEKITQSLNAKLSGFADVVPLTAEMLLKFKQGELKVVFSPEVQKMLQQGTARLARRGKTLIAKAVDPATGRFIETGEVVAGTVSLASLSAGAALVVVQAAHMISAADLAKTLNEVSNKLDLVIQYREIDQNSQLEDVYYKVRRLTGIDARAADRKQIAAEVRDIQSELVKLRAAWRDEAKLELQEIRNDPGWILIDAVTNRKGKEKSKNQTKMRAAARRLRMIDYTFFLERMLLDALPEFEEDDGHLDGQLADLKKVMALFEGRSSALYLGNEADQWARFRTVLEARLERFEPYIEQEKAILSLSPPGS